MIDRDIAALEAMNSAPSITINGVTILHNELPWRTAKNRHPTTNGLDWGWIDGAPGHICWEDGTRFGRKEANEAAQRHKEWLEEQKRLAIKLVEARDNYTKTKAELDRVATRYIEAKAAFTLAEDRLISLNAESSAPSCKPEQS